MMHDSLLNFHSDTLYNSMENNFSYCFNNSAALPCLITSPQRNSNHQVTFHTLVSHSLGRGVTGALIGGGGVFSYIHVLPDKFLLKFFILSSFQKKLVGQNTNL